ncbi:MAG: mechanosensitive ion channel [Myxococcales bacterium]|nr:mechanosensitive ion channel [Deltaproteobacteria bacterium]NNL22839.1 mechanosensitive ion channel [Myxococcales bacterium]
MAALAFICGVGVMGAQFAHAQTPAPQPEAAPEAPPPEAPKNLTGSDFAIEAAAVDERLSRIETEMSLIDVLTEVTEALDAVDAEGAALGESLAALGTRRVMSSELNDLQARIEYLDARVDRQISKLSAYGAELEALSTQNDEDIALWAEALKRGRRSSVPNEVLARTASILQGLREGGKLLQGKASEVLEVQSRALDVRDGLRIAQQRVGVAQGAVVDSVFERQAPPIWRSGERSAEDGTREGYDLAFSWPAVKDYLSRKRALLIFQALIALLLGLLITRARALVTERTAKLQNESGATWEHQASQSLRHPWPAALLVSIAMARFLHSDRTVEMILLTWLVALPLWFVVYKEMVPAGLRHALIGLAVLGTFQVVLALASGHPEIERALLLAELLLAGAGAAWLIRFLRGAEVSKRVRQGLWFSVTSLWARLALLSSVMGAGAAVLGYIFLATEASLFVIIGTIGATAYMAVERVVEALLLTGVHTGRFDAFRMVRANRHVTEKAVSRTLRLLTFAVFAWLIADITSAWRPMARVLGQWLSSDLGMGLAETGVTFGHFFGFFFVLWLGWITARFVSFVLGEEILPRLHMQQGVPFALTTFTRYAIIAVGFVAAISVLGVPLDRVTIVLSALGVGIGFGLQNLVNNFVSGFVLLTERPIRLRDKVEIDDILGNVSSIGIRASTIRTFDGAEVIVPNGDLISGRVINWTLAARQQRVTIPLGVAYGTDPNEVLDILRSVATANERVFESPAPLALFRGFGESSLDFELRIFMDPSDVLDVPSAVHVAINEALKEAGIKIPFPQRDLHLRGVPEGIAGTDTGTDTDTDTDTDADPDADPDPDSDTRR